MKKIGFIGIGHMGGALLRALIKCGSVREKEIIVSNRSFSKLEDLRKEFHKIEIAKKNIEVAEKSDLLFICVNTYEVVNVIEEIKQHVRTGIHIITVAGGLKIDSIEKKLNVKITKVIPSLTCEVFEGTTLICHNRYVEENERTQIENILGNIGKVLVISEEQFPIYTALSSCAPGLISAIFDILIASALRYGKIDANEAFKVILSSIEGTSKLLQVKNESFSNLVSRVARIGGNTEIGVDLFKKNFPEVFDTMFSKMLENEKDRNLKTDKQFRS